jgi:hypothetical protein
VLCWCHMLDVASGGLIRGHGKRRHCVDGCHNKVEGEGSCSLLTFSLKYGNMLRKFQTLDGG